MGVTNGRMLESRRCLQSNFGRDSPSPERALDDEHAPDSARA